MNICCFLIDYKKCIGKKKRLLNCEEMRICNEVKPLDMIILFLNLSMKSLCCCLCKDRNLLK